MKCVTILKLLKRYTKFSSNIYHALHVVITHKSFTVTEYMDDREWGDIGR